MNFVSGTYRDGTVELNEPVDWPEGTQVDVVHSAADSGGQEQQDFLGDGSPYPTTRAGLDELLRRMAQIQPFELSEEEAVEFEERLESWRAEQKELARGEADKLDELFK
ncbi:MAG: hypothetical protein QF473_33490 [Planctomycetota bacterium]|jgi:hypothetical protein|nr:hypothetical protein [Planctomycetota bacterium]MDP6505894.1 hypothetical protein [Planctomycetota bacterium]